MKEAQFTAARQSDWQAWDAWLAAQEQGQLKTKKDKKENQPTDWIAHTELPHRFRVLCSDLSLARARNYSAPLVDQLHDRVLRVQQKIYGAQPQLRHAWLIFLIRDFPALVRAQWRFVVPACLLFFVPLFAFIAAAQYWPESVYLVIPPESAASYERMYAPDTARLGREEASSDFAMYGMYIWNNIRIDFQCFAAGLLFGIGSIFFLVYNGLVIGAIAGHLTKAGLISTFWGFVAGHSSFELLGACLSGAAGLMLGHALIAPGPLRRTAALQRAAQTAVKLLYGATFMTFCAAFIEAFWSPLRTVPPTIKYAVGLALWTLLIAYLLLAGRGTHTRSPANSAQRGVHAT